MNAATVAHTPGPWRIDPRSGHGQDVRSDVGLVAEAFAPDEDTRRANARLIATAPELLAEAKALIDWIQGRIGADTKSDLALHFLKLQMAVAKAEGRSEP